MELTARQTVADLCDRYGYPGELRQALEAACRALERFSPESVLLVGSAARGEMTFRRTAGRRLELLSDIEMVCIADRSLATQVRAALEAVAARCMEEDIVPNAFFHFDALVVPSVRSGPEARGLFWYEAAHRHERLLGREGRYFGPVDAPVSLPLIAQLIIVRLFWMAVQLPVTAVRPGGATALPPGEREMFFYSLVRNVLDVPSIWLPHEGVLRVGYRERLEYLQSHWGTLRGESWLGPEFLELVADATRRKLTCDLDGDPGLWYPVVVGAYERLAAFLVDLPVELSESELLRELERDWTTRNEPPVSRRFRVAAVARSLRIAATRAGPLWLFRRGDPDAEALCMLMALHQAVRAAMAGDEAQARGRLSDARRGLQGLAGRQPDDGGRGFVREWHAVRRAAVPAMLGYFRKLRGHADAIEERMRGEDARI